MTSGWGNPEVYVPNPYVPAPIIGIQAATASLMQSVGAFPLVPGAGDAAIVVTVPPGAYTISIQDVEDDVSINGIVLIEIYEVP
jgi:hypothetical protein